MFPIPDVPIDRMCATVVTVVIGIYTLEDSMRHVSRFFSLIVIEGLVSPRRNVAECACHYAWTKISNIFCRIGLGMTGAEQNAADTSTDRCFARCNAIIFLSKVDQRGIFFKFDLFFLIV